MEGISVEQAVEQILQHTPVINETEETELNKAGGRILAQDMVAGFDNPPFDRSPVDGYACKAEDLAGAAKEHPVMKFYPDSPVDTSQTMKQRPKRL